MSIFAALKNALTAGSREITKDYSKNSEFLAAVCASSALVANSDGSIADTERDAAVRVVSNHGTLSKLYDQKAIRDQLEYFFRLSKDASGRQACMRAVEKAAGDKVMSEDAYLVAVDIAMADGKLEDTEQKMLERIAKTLGVDPNALMT